jgi:hypothetical protein
MKMLLLIYGREADEDILHGLKQAGIAGYTKMEEARGEGTETEPKLGTHVWPGRNNVVFTALPDEEIERVKLLVKDLKASHPRAGLRGFVLPVEESL